MISNLYSLDEFLGFSVNINKNLVMKILFFFYNCLQIEEAPKNNNNMYLLNIEGKISFTHLRLVNSLYTVPTKTQMQH